MCHMVLHEWTWKTGVLLTELPSFPLQVQDLGGKVFLRVSIFANKLPIITYVWHHDIGTCLPTPRIYVCLL